MKLLRLILIYALCFMFAASFILAANVPLNVQGTISGTCDAYVNISIQGYCPGEIGNVSCSVDNASVIANAAGVYGTALTYDNAVYATGIDVIIFATNTSCSIGAQGNNTLLNAVGGGPPVTINANITNSFTLDAPLNGSTETNQTINFSWTNNIVTPNSTLQIDNNSNFASVEFTIGNITDPNVTAVTSLLDGLYYWRVLTYIGATLIQQSGVNNFTMANEAPAVETYQPNSSQWIVPSSVVFNITTNLPAWCAYATTASTSYLSKTQFSSTGATSHSTTISSLSAGANNIYVQCNGTNGKLMPAEVVTTINRDNSNPLPGNASIDSGATHTTSTTVNVSWSGFSDSVSSVAGYYVNTTNNQGTTTGYSTTSSSLLLSGLSDGVITAYVWAIDLAGNIGTAASDSITVDTTPPTFGSWSTSPINVNIFTTSDVTLYVTVTDTSSLLALPQLSYAIGTDSFSTAANMTLVSGSVYSFTIPNQATPNDWATRGGENLTITVSATDARGFANASNYTILINDQFNAPVFTAISSTTKTQGVYTSFDLRASDVDGDTLVFTTNHSEINITTLNSTAATAYWTPTNDDVGLNILFFTVTDGIYNVSQAVAINVTDVNDAPVLSSIGDLSAYEYEEFTYTINASDPDNDVLSYSANTSLFVIGSSGTFTFTPSATQRGDQTIQFSVSDGNGGVDRENVTFTVLYCGDAICSSSYESTSSCEVDCEEDETSQGFIIDSKTCFGDSLSIKAVELVSRTSCPSKGTIINGWESCGNMTDTTILIEQDIQDSYVEVASLLTDTYGLASYTPLEIGSYRLRYDDTKYDENIVYFSVNVCTQDINESSSSADEVVVTEPQVNLPFFEEPLTNEQIVKLSNTSRILYYILLPFLFILLSVAALSTYYRYDKRKGSGSFSQELDKVLQKVDVQLASITTKVRSSKTYQKMKSYFKVLENQLVDTKQVIMKTIEPLVKTKNVQVPFFASEVSRLSESKLLLKSAYASFYNSKNMGNFTSALQRESLFENKNLRLFALNALKLGLPITYLFSATNDKHELLQLHEKASVKKSYPTLTDIKLELLKGRIMFVPLHMNSLNKSAPKKNFLALITGYSPDGFYMLEYSFSRSKKTFVPTAVFQKAWIDSGYLECAIIKK